MLPAVTSFAARDDMNGAGSVFSILAMAPFGQRIAVDGTVRNDIEQ